jgi:glycosyltransferase involved in cell wall biosynthesis
LKLLYVATDQLLPGSTGGSVHVEEVARGLTERGHEVHVVARPGPGGPEPLGGRLHPAKPLFQHRFFRWTAERAVGELLDRLGSEVVLERYYNFGGEGVRAAARRGIPSVLEVNSPIRDHPGSLKSILDAALLLRPLRRARDGLCRKAAALVTPLPSIVPASIPREKVFQIHWGANVELFKPDVPLRGGAERLSLPADARVVVFSSSFRRWHGARLLVRAAAQVIAAEAGEKAFFLFLGSGPELAAVERDVDRLGLSDRVRLAGAVPYAEMPFYLARAHLGVAPFEPARHGQLQLGFYWSPLKIFEYMASGLPVVTLDIDPLREIVRPGREGLLVGEGDAGALAAAILELVSSPERARAMGRAARQRVVEHFSWQRHCEKLEQVLERVRKR